MRTSLQLASLLLVMVVFPAPPVTAQNLDCEGAPDPGCSFEESRNVVGFGSVSEYSCELGRFYYRTQEVVYKVFSGGDWFEFELTYDHSSANDLDLFLLSGCSETACVESSTGSSGREEICGGYIGYDHYLVIDGFEGRQDGSNFTVSWRCYGAIGADAGGPYAGNPGESITFRGEGRGGGTTIVRYRWDFGDGQGATSQNGSTSHTYQGTGSFTVTLTVTDDYCAPRTASNATSASITREPCTLRVTSPNGGENWVEGTEHEIRWDQSGDCGSTVRIRLMRDGSACRTLVASAPNNGSFDWVAEQCNGQTSGYRLQIVDLSTEASDQSDSSFNIPDSCTLDLVSPDGGERWVEGSTKTITWDREGDCGAEVTIELQYDESYCATIAARAPNNGSYAWLVDACQGDYVERFRVRVTDQETDLTSRSANFFTILAAPSLAITSPRAADVWHAGENATIRWQSTSAGERVKIEFRAADASSWIVIAEDAANSGEHAWQVPEVATDTARIRITSVSEPTASDTSEHFSINPLPSCDAGGPYPGTAGVVIEFDGSGSSDDGAIISYGWSFGDGAHASGARVTHVYTVSGGFTVALVLTDDDGGRSQCATAVEVADVWLRVVSPSPGTEDWPVGSIQTIEWSSGGEVIQVDLELSRDGGVTWSDLAGGMVNNTGTYTWLVTGPATSQALVRITGNEPPFPIDQSDAPFSISMPPLEVTPASLAIDFDPIHDSSGQTHHCPEGGISITNPRGAAVEWSATSEVAWLAPTPAAGTLGVEESILLQVCVVREVATGLGGGPYSGRVTIDSGGSSQPVEIELTVSQYEPGDVNANRVLEIADLDLLLRYILRIDVPPLTIRSLGLTDVNGDESEDVADLVTLAPRVAESLLRRGAPGGVANGASGGVTVGANGASSGLTLHLFRGDAPAALRLSLSGAGMPRTGAIGLRWIGEAPVVRRLESSAAQFETAIAQDGGEIVVVFVSVAPVAQTETGSEQVVVAELVWDGATHQPPVFRWGYGIDASGTMVSLGGVDLDRAASPERWLRPAFPNPLRGETRLVYELAEASHVRLSIYDPNGRLVRALLVGERDAGVHEEIWRGQDDRGRLLPAGVYFLRLETTAGTMTQRAVILR